MDEFIELSHGAGGIKMDLLLKEIQSIFSLRNTNNGTGIDSFDDGAFIQQSNTDFVITTDGHSVDPLFFPGGDIGKLSICGTLNDLAVMGAKPVALTCSLFIEEGFPFKDLKKILLSMDDSCRKENVPIIAGDTKVIPKNKIDKLMIVTTGFGQRVSNQRITDDNVQVGDKIIVTGPVGSHGIALLSFREGLSFKTKLTSDVACLSSLLLPLAKKFPIHAMKDPTRGGLASAINEWAEKSKVTITLQQDKIPIEKEVQSASDLLGLDPLEISCEGRALIAVQKEFADEVLKELRKHPLGHQSSIIGKVINNESSKVLLETTAGGLRRLQKPLGELIPRVC